MSDEIKSALDLAMEKLEKSSSGPIRKLSDDQKKRIAEIRAKFQARIAEAEISAQAGIKKASSAGDHPALEAVKASLVDEKRKLENRMEKEIEKIRSEESAPHTD